MSVSSPLPDKDGARAIPEHDGLRAVLGTPRPSAYAMPTSRQPRSSPCSQPRRKKRAPSDSLFGTPSPPKCIDPRLTHPRGYLLPEGRWRRDPQVADADATAEGEPHAARRVRGRFRRPPATRDVASVGGSLVGGRCRARACSPKQPAEARRFVAGLRDRQRAPCARVRFASPALDRRVRRLVGPGASVMTAWGLAMGSRRRIRRTRSSSHPVGC